MEDTDEKDVLGEQGEKLSKTSKVSWLLEACLDDQVMKYLSGLKQGLPQRRGRVSRGPPENHS